MTTVHIVGAGVAGLACAIALTQRGIPVILHEGAGHAGGRCRSFHDDTLGCVIDNGNHLLLSGNSAVDRYLTTVDAVETLSGPDRAKFDFYDLETQDRWTLQPNSGPLPFWLLRSDRRVPGTGFCDYARAIRLAHARPETTVARFFGTDGQAFRRFWDPLAVAVLNTPSATAAAAPLWPVLRETFGRGEAACRPRIARTGLSDSFVDPALRYLAQHGADVRFGHLLRGIDRERGRVTALDFADGHLSVAEGDCIVLAIPHHRAGPLLPELTVPPGSHAIVNAHFRLSSAIGDADSPRLLGLVGGTAQWLFVRGDLVSVTVSAADSLADAPAPAIAALLWKDVAQALERRTGELPPYRIVKERRATFSQTPEGFARRPGTRTPWHNLLLAGDWTATGLPATIEGAIRSGFAAAMAIG